MTGVWNCLDRLLESDLNNNTYSLWENGERLTCTSKGCKPPTNNFNYLGDIGGYADVVYDIHYVNEVILDLLEENELEWQEV